jgi:3-amino-4-hydroxybenzoic acid synthase
LWLDIRHCAPDLAAGIVELAADQGVEAVIADRPDGLHLGASRGGSTWVVLDESGCTGAGVDGEADIRVRTRNGAAPDLSALRFDPGKKHGLLFDIIDKTSLDEACSAVRLGLLTVVRFKDPTKIPLEIVLAAGSRRHGKIMTFVADAGEARVVTSVLQTGPDGIIAAPRSMAEAAELARLCSPAQPHLDLKEFAVQDICHAGTGERVCVDTCSHFLPDEGLLVGSFGGRFLLCSSETHPLPYMPTRPFRVNAGTVCSYVLARPDRTHYLSELGQGDVVTAVRTNGATRSLVVGRTKTETRPLLLVRARSADGEDASLILQNDWHVRVLGPGGLVHNVTELRPGSPVLGFSAAPARHVGMPVEEFCLER